MAREATGDLAIYTRLLGYVKPLWLAFLVSILGYLVYSASNAALAELMKRIVDAIGSDDARERMLIPVAMVSITLLRGIGSFLGAYCITLVSTNVVHSLRCELFDKLMKVPSRFYDHNALGHLVSKVTFHVTQVTGAATEAVKVVIREGFTVIGLLLYLLYKNWLLTLVFISVAPFIALLVNYAGKRFRVISRRIQRSMGDVTHVVSEAVQGYKVVRTFGGEGYERKRFTRVSDYNRQQSVKMAVTSAISTPVIQFVVASAMGFLVWLALDPKLIGDMTTGDVIAFITAAGLIAKPVRQLSEVNATIQRGLAAANDIFAMYDEEIEADLGTRELVAVTGALEFRDVSFAYSPDAPAVLRNVSFRVEPGQTVALVGRSGSGKSTLASLIPRFYSPTAGEILIDGEGIQNLTLANLRSHMALVTQQVTLFNDSVARNIAYGSLEDADMEAIASAASKAHASEFIEELENGFDTIVGDDGVLLSGGQRQRLALARAFLKDAPILILDEATSALDSESERYIQAALEDVVRGRTTIIIAHRLSTIENADRILVLDEGQVVEQGTHNELLAKGGAYAQLHHHQFHSDERVPLKGGPRPATDRPGIASRARVSDLPTPRQSTAINPIVRAWYGEQRWVRWLRPLSFLYQALTGARRRGYAAGKARRWQAPVPVIVVGNIAVGGTGKSPLVIWLAQQMRNEGVNVGIVSRGYRGRAHGYPLRVGAESDPAEAGDEAVMIARRSGCPVVVDPDRTRAVRTLIENHACDLVISDDGLQHYALHRDIEIAVVDGERGLGNRLCLPAGPLREPPERLKEVDFVVVNGPPREALPCTTLAMALEPVSWVNISTGEELSLDAWRGERRVHGVAAIGNPGRFFATLHDLGFEVIEHPFDDHQVLGAADLIFSDRAPVVMTEKDAVRCEALVRELAHVDYWYLRVSVTMDRQFVRVLLDRAGMGEDVSRAAVR